MPFPHNLKVKTQAKHPAAQKVVKMSERTGQRAGFSWCPGEAALADTKVFRRQKGVEGDSGRRRMENPRNEAGAEPADGTVAEATGGS